MIKNKIKSIVKLNNLVLKKGKKSKASTLILNTLYLLKKKTKKNPIILMNKVIKMLTPGVTTKKTVVAGRLYHLPTAITKNKALYFACSWLKQAAKDTKDKSNLDVKIAQECFKVLVKKAPSLVLLKQHNKVVSENKPFLRFIRKKRLPKQLWLRKKRIRRLQRNAMFAKKKAKLIPREYYDFDPLGKKFIVLPEIKYSKRTQRDSDKIDRFLERQNENIKNKTINKKSKLQSRKKLRVNNKSKKKKLQKKNLSLRKFKSKRL